MARYRLRFLLQEFDLPRGATLIGRSSDCHVTIEDPLVSREHARIIIDADGAMAEDLGSRNGVKINGVAIPARGTAKVKDGDRLRIGTQELVFCTVGSTVTTSHSAKTTGFLRYCAHCRLPYPQEMAACPACGETEQVDEETLNGQGGDASQNTWGVKLLIEVMEKALQVGRVDDAVRVVQRAKTQLEEQLAGGSPIDPEQFHVVAGVTLRVVLAAKEPVWACWIAHLYGQLKMAPSDAVLALFTQISTEHPGELGPPLADLLAALREVVSERKAEMTRPQLDAHRVAISRLETLLLGETQLSPEGGAEAREDTNPAIS